MIRESHPPSFHWKEVPRRGGGWLPQRDENACWTSAALDLQCAAGNSTQAFFKKRRLTYCLTFVVSLSARRISRLRSKWRYGENAISKLRRSRYLLAFPAWGRGIASAVDRVLRYCMTAEQALEEGPRQRRRIECLVEAQISRTENDECETSAARIVIPSAVEGSFLYSGKTVILG